MNKKTDKKRILLFIKTPPPYHGASIANKFIKDSTTLKQEYQVRAIDSHYSNSISELGKFKLSKLGVFTKSFFKITWELLFFRPELVHFQLSHGVLFREIVFITLIKASNIKILFHLQGKGIKSMISNSKIKKALFRYSFKNEDIICLSKKLVRDIEDVFEGIPFILPNCAIDYNLPKSLVDPDYIKLIYISNLIKTKGILDVLEAVSVLASKGLLFKLTIIGAEGDVSPKEINSFIEENGLEEKVVYLGPVYGMNKLKYLYSSDVFLFPTYYFNEAFPLSIVEAMEASLPIISTDEGGISDLVDNEITGFLVEKSSPEQIADKIQLLIENPELRRSMGVAARKKYEEKYTLAHFENNLKAVFEEILTNKHNL